MEAVLSAFKLGQERKAFDDQEGAHHIFKGLADIALAPAQREVALYYRDESRDDLALEKAIMWAQLATWGGDHDAAKLVQQLIKASRHKVVEDGLAMAKNWLPFQSHCTIPASSDSVSEDFAVAGHIAIARHENVPVDAFLALADRLNRAFDTAQKVAPKFFPLAQLIPMIEIVPGEGTERFIDWQTKKGRYLVSSTYLLDDSERQLAYGLVLAVQRQIYKSIEGAIFKDPIGLSFGRIEIFGSLYGDVRTQEFLKTVLEAVKLSHELPSVLHDLVYQIDEIYYMPPSRYHHSSFTHFKEFMTYDHKRSGSSRRLVRINHEIGLIDPEGVLLELVKVGHFAREHVRIEGLRNSLEGKMREESLLKALEGKIMEETGLKTNQLQQAKEDVTLWDQKGPTGNPRIVCDAVLAQTKAAMRLKISPLKVSRFVQMKSCKQARTLWQKFMEET